MDNDELNIDELEHIQAGTGLEYEEARQRTLDSVGPLRANDEMSMDELGHVEAGTPLGYEEAKQRSEGSLGKFRDAALISAAYNSVQDSNIIHQGQIINLPQEVKRVEPADQLGELSEEDLEQYLGGIRIQDEEYKL